MGRLAARFSGAELGDVFPNVVAVGKIRFFRDLAGEKASGDGRKGDKTDVIFQTIGDDGLHHPALHHEIDALRRG